MRRLTLAVAVPLDVVPAKARVFNFFTGKEEPVVGERRRLPASAVPWDCPPHAKAKD